MCYVSILWQLAIFHACGRDRRRFLCFRSLIPSRSKLYNARQDVFSAVCHACALPSLGNAFQFVSPAANTEVLIVPRTSPSPSTGRRHQVDMRNGIPDRPRADLESLNTEQDVMSHPYSHQNNNHDNV